MWPKQTQSNPISESPKLNLSGYMIKDCENKSPIRARVKQTQSFKIPDNLSIIISAPFLTGLDYFLFFEYSAGQIISKGNLDC